MLIFENFRFLFKKGNLMAIYIALFLIAVVLGLILVRKNPSKPKKIIYLSVMFGLMYVVTVMRYGVGNDYFSYMRIFEDLIHAEWGEAFTLGLEPLFVVLTKCMAVFTHNPEVMYAIYAFIILVPVAIAIYRHSTNVWISVTVYLCFTFFYTSLSFIRQSIAVSILILAFGFIKERKIVPVIIMAVVAALFHYTAAVFIPLYLISLIKPTKKYLIIYGSVSVGALIICLVMKALGANPVNVVADIVTAVTGKDYSSYIGSMWFEVGFGVQYLIMPLALLAFVMISYFLGWKDKKEAPVLLQFTLMNASIWSFITYAFIIERFSMFVFIFSVFTVPSVLSYYEEKADAEAALAQSAKENKKMPGYSKKKSEEKRDNSFLLTTCAVIGMFIYNCWGMVENFHGVFPYMCKIPEIQGVIDDYDTPEENLEVMYGNADLYTFLVQLKEADCGYMILSTADDYSGFTHGVRRAADYAGTGLNRPSDIEAKTPFYFEYNNRNGEEIKEEFIIGTFNYETENGTKIELSENAGLVTDPNGNSVKLSDNRLSFILIDENGLIFDATEYEVHSYARRAAKLYINQAAE